MSKIYQVIIVGGGASGLLCATELVSGHNAFLGNDIAILERTDRVGKKLIATGNGQGNLSNQNITTFNYYGDKNFIDIFLAEYNKLNLEDYFNSLGIPMSTMPDGKKYPLSKQANSVLDTIRAYLISKGVNTITDFYAQTITKENGVYKVSSKDKCYYAKNVVLAVGGASGKQFGTDGTSYVLAQSLGHGLTKLYPSLVQIKTDTTLIKSLKGLKEQAKITAYDGDVELKSAVGEVLFTEYGISGNAVFQVSGHLTTAKTPSVKIEFLPELTLSQTEQIVGNRIINAPFVEKCDILNGILSKRVGQVVLKTAKDQTPKSIAYAIKNFTIKVTGNLGFNFAQVTKGGIQTDRINPFTFESKLSRGVYIVGEQLDVDGDCGGYNLTFAFTSGILSAKAIKNKKEN